MSSLQLPASILTVLMLLSGCGSGEPVKLLDPTPPDPSGTPRIRAGATKNSMEKIPNPSEGLEKSSR